MIVDMGEWRPRSKNQYVLLEYTGELRSDHLAGAHSRTKISIKHVFDRRRSTARGLLQHPFYCTWNAQEGNATFEEGGDCDFIGGVEGDTSFSSGLGGLI